MGKDFNYSGVSGGNGNYSIDEIDRARKMQKKGGGTLLENLAKLTGRGMSSSKSTMDISTMYNQARQQAEAISEAEKRQKEIEAKNEAVRKQLLENQDKLNQALDNYTTSLKEDFGIQPQQDNSWMQDFGLTGQGSTGVSGGASGAGNLGAVDGGSQNT